MKILLEPDANTPGGSSPPTSDANGHVAPPPSSEAENPTTVEQPDKAPVTLADVARQAYEESLARNAEEPVEPKPEVAPAEESPVQDPNKTPEEEPVPEEEDKAPEKDQQFNEHPRFKELMSQRDEARSKVTELDQKAKEFEPLAKQQAYHSAFCKQYGITDQEVQQVMNFLALRRQDPLKAREALEPLWKSLSELDPNTLPRELMDAVANNEISEAMAKRLWQAETRSRAGEQSGRFAMQQTAIQREQARSDAITSWDMTKRGLDPDFKPKAKAEQTDGLWELTAKGYTYLLAVRPPQTIQDEVHLMEQAYKEAKATCVSLKAPVRPTAKVPTSQRSSANSRSAPKSIDDVVSQTVRKHGITWPGRKVALKD